MASNTVDESPYSKSLPGAFPGAAPLPPPRPPKKGLRLRKLDGAKIISRRQSLNLPREMSEDFKPTFEQVKEDDEEQKSEYVQANISAPRAPEYDVEQLKKDYEVLIKNLKEENMGLQAECQHSHKIIAKQSQELQNVKEHFRQEVTGREDVLKDRSRAMQNMQSEISHLNQELIKHRQSIETTSRERRVLVNGFQSDSLSMKKKHEEEKEKLIQSHQESLKKASESHEANIKALKADMNAVRDEYQKELARIRNAHKIDMEAIQKENKHRLDKLQSFYERKEIQLEDELSMVQAKTEEKLAEMRNAHESGEKEAQQAAMKADKDANQAQAESNRTIAMLHRKHKDQLTEMKLASDAELKNAFAQAKAGEERLEVALRSMESDYEAQIQMRKVEQEKKDMQNSKKLEERIRAWEDDKQKSEEMLDKLESQLEEKEIDAQKIAKNSQEEKELLKNEHANQVRSLHEKHQAELDEFKFKAEAAKKELHQQYDAVRSQQSQKHKDTMEQEDRRRTVAAQKDLNTMQDQHKKNLESLSKKHQTELLKAHQDIEVMRVAANRVKSEHDLAIVTLKEEHSVELASLSNGPNGINELKQEHERLVTKLNDELKLVYSRVDQLQQEGRVARKAYGGNLQMIIQLNDRMREGEQTLFEREKTHQAAIFDRDTEITRLGKLLDRLNTVTGKTGADAAK